jgi:hypothetical protein
MSSNLNCQHGYNNSMDGSNYQQSRHDSTAGSGSDYYPPPLNSMGTEHPSHTNGYNPPPPPPYPSSSATGTKPIADAVNNAFDNSTAANQVPAEVIAQITEQVRSQVIDTLRKELAGAPPVQSAEPQQSQRQPYPNESDNGINVLMPSAHQTHSFGPGHPFSSGPVPQPNKAYYGSSPAKSVRAIHTPPTPERDSEESTYFGQNEGLKRRSSKRASQDYTSSRPIPIPESSNRTSSPVRGSMKEDLSARYGDRSREGTPFSSSDRPLPTRTRTNDDETVVEKMWQPLFDGAGKPTARNNQFLRGIALQLVWTFFSILAPRS